MGTAWVGDEGSQPRKSQSLVARTVTIKRPSEQIVEPVGMLTVTPLPPKRIDTVRKTVAVCELPIHKDSSDRFRRHSRNFEAAEFTAAQARGGSSSSGSEDSDSEGEKKRTVRFVEVPGLGESSPNFRRKSHEFTRNEFPHAKDLNDSEEEVPTPVNSAFPRPIRMRKERSKTTVVKAMGAGED